MLQMMRRLMVMKWLNAQSESVGTLYILQLLAGLILAQWNAHHDLMVSIHLYLFAKNVFSNAGVLGGVQEKWHILQKKRFLKTRATYFVAFKRRINRQIIRRVFFCRMEVKKSLEIFQHEITVLRLM